MHFLPVFELMSGSLTAIQVKPPQCPLQHSILLTHSPKTFQPGVYLPKLRMHLSVIILLKAQIRKQMSGPEISKYGKSILDCGLWPGLASGIKGFGPIMSNFFGFFFHCFVMNEVFWRFQKLSSIPSKSGTRDLEFQSGP